jgi:hypothetical protein
VTYTPDWESIRKAADRIATAGNPKTQAKSDLCLAISDRKIAVRLYVVSPPSLGLRKQLLESSMLDVPRKLVLSDIDWRRSRPANCADLWIDVSRRPGEFNMIHLERIRPFMGWIAELIEVKVADLVRIFSLSDSTKPVPPKPAEQIPKPAFNRRAKRDGIRLAINALWPEGIPKGLTAKDRDRQINEWLKAKGLSISDRRTIQRAL